MKEPKVFVRDYDFDNNINLGLIIFTKKLNGTTNRIKNRMSTFQITAEDKSKQRSTEEIK